MNKHLILTCFVALAVMHTALSKKYKVGKHHGRHIIKRKVCNDLPNWKNRWGQADCSMVRKKNYCYDGWTVRSTTRVFKSRNTWPKSKSGVTMLQACCQCGGGFEKMASDKQKKEEENKKKEEKTKEEERKTKQEQDDKKKEAEAKAKAAEAAKKKEEEDKKKAAEAKAKAAEAAKKKEQEDKKNAEEKKKKEENGPAKPLPLVTHYISHYGGLKLHNVKCYDEPGWKSNSLLGSQDCAYVRSKFYCKDGQYWRHKALFHRFNTWPKNPEGMSMMDACCQCGGGTMKGKGTFAEKEKEYKRKAEEKGKKVHEQKVKWKKAKESLPHHVINGKLCFDLPGWTSKYLRQGQNCDYVKQVQYCRDGHYNRKKAFFHNRWSSYPKNNEGVSMLDACCQCGGGTIHTERVNNILKKKKVPVPRRVQYERTLAGFL